MNSVLITGTNRGVGLGLIKTLLGSKNVPKHIIATSRKPAEAIELRKIAESNKNVYILEFDVTNFQSYSNLVQKVKNLVEDDGLNVVINNAGISEKFHRIGLLKPETMINTYIINTVAPIILTKELLGLLKIASEKNSTLPLGPSRAAVINMSSLLGSISENTSGGLFPYRCSKSALNSATRTLSIDLKPYNILVVSIHPGWVKTDMGGEKAPLTVEFSTKNIIETINNLNETHNGCFINYDGSSLPW